MSKTYYLYIITWIYCEDINTLRRSKQKYILLSYNNKINSSERFNIRCPFCRVIGSINFPSFVKPIISSRLTSRNALPLISGGVRSCFGPYIRIDAIVPHRPWVSYRCSILHNLRLTSQRCSGKVVRKTRISS